MPTVRRVYFYLVTLIGLELVIWGVISLAQTLFNPPVGGPANILANGLSLVLVGLPIFLLHGAVVQRDARRDPEERASRLRAIFFYAVRLATAIPIAQSVVALVARLANGLLHIPTAQALIGVNLTITDHVIIMIVNALAWAYFDHQLLNEEKAAQEEGHLAEVRRLYRYLWMSYTLGLVILGVIEILWYLLNLPPITPVRSAINTSLANGLGFALVGAPLWAFSWMNLQRSLSMPGESPSVLRRVVLYILTEIPAVIVVISGVDIASSLFKLVFGEGQTLVTYLNAHRPAITALIVFGIVWTFYHRALRKEWENEQEEQSQQELRRRYSTLLAFIGNAVTFLGVWLLLAFLVDLLNRTILYVAGLEGQLSDALGMILIGGALWLVTWRYLQAEAGLGDARGERARRSILRRSYLYLVVFLAVLGVMANAGALLYQLINAALGNPFANLGDASHDLVQLLLCALWLSYHRYALRRDGRLAKKALAAQRADFHVVVLQADESPYYAELGSSLQALAPELPVSFWKLSEGMPALEQPEVQALVMPASVAAGSPPALADWLGKFLGKRILVPLKTDGWFLLGAAERPERELARDTALALRQLSEGEPVRQAAPSNPWVIVGYVFGGLFAVELLAVVFAVVLSFIGR